MGVAKSGVGLKAGLAAAGVGAALLAKEVYNVGKEFDDAYDKIRVGTGKTGKQLDRLKDDFKNVVSSVPTNFEDAAEAVAELNTRLNQSGKPLRERAKQFLELSRITDTDVTENIKSVTRAFGDWEVAAGKQGKQLDKFFRASQGSGASVAELAENVVKFGAPLRQIGMSLDEATAMFAAFEKAGVNTSTMLPGLKMAMKVALQEDKDPARFIKAAFKGIEDGSIKSSRALELFGTRAGGDMIEAVQQGRFHLEEFTKSLATGNETIRKAGQETMDTSENLQLLGNKIKVLVAPAAEWLFDAVGKLSKAFATMNFKPLLRDLGLTDREIKNLGEAFRKVMAFIGPLVKGVIDSIAKYLKGFVGVIKGVVRVISAVLSGDFKEAWEGVKDIFTNYGKAVLGLLRALTAPMRAGAKLVGGAIGDGFEAAWSKITGIFKSGANAAIGVLNSMIEIFNGIPFIPDIGKVGVIGGAGGNGVGRDVNGKSLGRQRGGMMFGGKPSGDSIPAMLERGEYVLNRNAVAKVGQRRLDALNFGAAPRFQEGGPVRLISGGDVWGAVKDVAGYTPPGLAFKGAKAAFGWAKGFPAVASAIRDIAGMAGRFPGWIDGSWFVNSAIDWLKGKTQAQAKERAARSYSAAYTGPPASMKQLGDNAWVDSHTLAVAAYLEKKFGVSRSSGYRDPAHNAAVGGVPGSLHTHGSSGNPGAIDFVPPSSAMQAWVGAHIAGVEENLIHDVGSGLHNHIGFFQSGGVVGKIGQILLRNGLDKEAAAGIIGNAFGESSWNPASMEPGTHNGGLWGFTASPVSLAEMKAYAASQGLPWTSVKAQTQFMLHNLSSSQRSALNSLDTVAQTTEWFMREWERPASMASLGTRTSAGERALGMLGSAVTSGKGKKGGGGKARFDPKTGGMQAPAGAAKGPNTPPKRLPMGAGSVPDILQGIGMKGIEDIFKMPGLSDWKKSELALALAGKTKQTWDDRQVMKFQLNFSKGKKLRAQKAIARINKQLATGRLTDKQRARLTAKRNNLLDQVGTWDERIGTAREGLRAEPEGVEAGEDPALKAQEENTRAVEEHTAALKGVQDEMKRQTDLAEGAIATNSATAWKALADIMSGALGGSAQQSAALAGAGGVGSLGRF